MEQFTIKLRPGMLAAIAMLWPLLVVVVYDLTGVDLVGATPDPAVTVNHVVHQVPQILASVTPTPTP